MTRLELVALSVAASLFASAAPASARSLAVPQEFPTIHAAVQAAAPGDTVRVAKGTYADEVVIDKDLTLRGARVDATTIKSPPILHSYGLRLPDGRGLTAIVRVWHGARVRMSGFTVSGPIPCGIEVTGVQALQGATLDLSDARVTGIQADPTTCGPDDAPGRAVVYGTPPHVVVDGEHGTTAYGRIAGVHIDHYQHAGISIAVAGTTVTENNLVGDDAGVYQVDSPDCCRIADNTLLGWRAAWAGAAISGLILNITPTAAGYYLRLVAGRTPVELFLMLAGVLITCYLAAFGLLLGAGVAARVQLGHRLHG